MSDGTVYRVGVDVVVKDGLKKALLGWSGGLSKAQTNVEKLKGELAKLDTVALKGFAAELKTMGEIAKALVQVNNFKKKDLDLEEKSVKVEGQRAVQAEKLAQEQKKTAAIQARMDRDAERSLARKEDGQAKLLRMQRETQAIESRTAQMESRRLEKSYAHLERMAALQKKIDRQNERNKPDGFDWSGAANTAGNVGHSVMSFLESTLHDAGHLDTAKTGFRQMGLGAADEAKAFNFARGLSTSAGGAGLKEETILENLKDLHNVTKNLDEAMELAPKFNKFIFTAKTLYHMSDKQAMDTAKAAEMMAKGKGPEFVKSWENNLDLFAKISNATMNRVTGSDFLNFSKTAGLSRFNLNDDAKIKMAALIQEQGGQRTGTGLMSLMQNLVFGRATQKSATALLKAGLLAPGSEIIAKNGSLKGFKSGGLVDSNLMMQDPMAWFEKHLRPIIAKEGLTKGLMHISDFMGNRTALNMAATSLAQADNIERDKQLIKNRALGIEGGYDNAAGSYAGNMEKFTNALENFKVRVGEKLLPTVTRFVTQLTDTLMKMTRFADNHPTLAKLGVGAAATVGAGGIGIGAAAPMISLLASLRTASTVASLAAGGAGAAGGAAGVGGIGAMAAGAGAAVGGALTAPVLVGIAVLTAGVALMVGAWKTNFLGFRTIATHAWADIKLAANVVGKVVGGIGHLFHGGMTIAVRAVKGAFENFGGWIIGPFQGYFQAVIDKFADSWLGKLISGGVSMVEDLVGSASAAAGKFAGAAAKWDEGTDDATPGAADLATRAAAHRRSLRAVHNPAALKVEIEHTGHAPVMAPAAADKAGAKVGTSVAQHLKGGARPSQTTPQRAR